jgi:hypothetical protein
VGIKENSELPIALYLRKSSGPKEDNISISKQKELGLEYVKKIKSKYKIFQEVESASRKGRKEFNNMLLDVVNKQISGIWVWNLNRLDRHVGDYIKLRDDIAELHKEDNFDIYIHCNNYKYKCWDSNDRTNMGFNAVMNEAVKDFITESTTQAKVSLLEKGFDVNGNVGYGFERNKGIITICEEEAIWCREIYRVFLLESIKTTKDVYEHLDKNNEDFPSDDITTSLIEKILKHIRYIGIRETKFLGKKYTINTDSIIDKENYYLVQDKFKKVNHIRKRYQKQEYTLKGLIECSNCGKEMIIIGGTSNYKYYSCKDKIYSQRIKNRNPVKWLEKYKNTEPCNCLRHNKINVDIIDKVVWDTLFDVMKQSKYVFKQLSKKYEKNKKAYNDQTGKIKYYEQQLKSLKTRQANAIIQAVNKGFDIEDELTSQFTKEQSKIELRIHELNNSVYNLNLIETDQEVKQNIINQLVMVHKDLSYSNVNTYIKRYISKVIVKRLTNDIKNTTYEIGINFKFVDEDLNKKFKIIDGNDNISILKNGVVQVRSLVSKEYISFKIHLTFSVRFPNNNHKVRYLDYSI